MELKHRWNLLSVGILEAIPHIRWGPTVIPSIFWNFKFLFNKTSQQQYCILLQSISTLTWWVCPCRCLGWGCGDAWWWNSLLWSFCHQSPCLCTHPWHQRHLFGTQSIQKQILLTSQSAKGSHSLQNEKYRNLGDEFIKNLACKYTKVNPLDFPVCKGKSQFAKWKINESWRWIH